MDALQASLKTPTLAVRLKVASLLRIFISSKDREVISLVLAAGCNRLFPDVMVLHLNCCDLSCQCSHDCCDAFCQIAPAPAAGTEVLEHSAVSAYVGLVHSFLSVHTSMLRRDACRNLSKIGAISALSSSLPFLFAQFKRSKRINIDSPSEQLFCQQNNLSCEEISQIAVWCSLGDVVSKKALLQDDFFSSIGLALQVLKVDPNFGIQHSIFEQATYPDTSLSLGADYTATAVSCGLKVNICTVRECAI